MCVCVCLCVCVCVQAVPGSAVSAATISKDVVFGVMSPDGLWDLEATTKGVFLPLIQSSRAGWSEVVSKEVVSSMHGLLVQVSITTGATQGLTRLPLPHSLAPRGARRSSVGGGAALPSKSADAVSLDRMHVYEGCVVTWTKQIKAVLRQDPESMLMAAAATSTSHSALPAVGGLAPSATTTTATTGAAAPPPAPPSATATATAPATAAAAAPQPPAHPEPLTELDFWDAKARNFNSIFTQLQSDPVRRMLRSLDAARSTYAVSFGALCREVFAARAEANDNVRFLAPLRPWFERLERCDHFPASVKLFRPIMHGLLNVWKYSRFYNTPTRLVVIMREISNCLVRTAKEYVSADRVLACIEQGEPQRPVALLMTTLKVCGIFKSTYFDYKARAALECPDRPWRIQNSALFSRLDRFLERCHDIRDLAQAVVAFSRLAHLEIGGTKGKTLTTSIQQIYSDFNAAVGAFRTVPYDFMDVDADGFDNDFYAFRVTVKELERRLGSVLTQGFDDAPTTSGRFKLLDSFDALLERPVVAEELERKHLDLLTSYSDDIAAVQTMFLESRDDPPTPHNTPPCAGALMWARGLLARVQIPMEKLRHLNRALLDREEARTLVKVYTSLVASLADFEHARAEDWARHVESASSTNLKKPLLARDDDPPHRMRVNFDPALVCLLREVKYFLALGLSVPPAALAVFKRGETLRKHAGNLELIVNMYNSVVTGAKPVERPLLVPYLAAADRSLAAGLHTLTWKSHGIDLYVSEAMNVVRHAKDVLDGMSHNMRTVQRMLQGWADAPMMQRNKSKPLVLDVLDPQVRVLAFRVSFAAC